MENRYITLAIHTYDYAVGLCKVLEENGIAARLENVDLEGKSLSSGVRVRIPSASLPLALKIVENSMALAPAVATMKLEGLGSKILIPVDFSPYSYVACRTGFAFAHMLGVEAVLLNVYASPYFDGNLAGSDGFSIDVADSQVRKDLADAAHIEMLRLARRLRTDIIHGVVPPVKFSTETMEGVPEDAILEYARIHPPMLIVMATRGAHKKASEVIGSVTAEVLDSCRIPILTVPENFSFSSFGDLDNVVFFCNVNQQDLLAMDVFMRLMPSVNLNVCLVPVSERSGNRLRERMEALEQYCSKQYPRHRFSCRIIGSGRFRADIERFITDESVSMLVVPNKKQNAFSRLFNPGIAHRIIFERDIPMLALPV